MSLRPQLEAIIYAAEAPISLDQILSLVKESLLAETPGIDAAEMKSRIRAVVEELTADYSRAEHGIEIRQIAGGYRMSTKPDQHDVVRAFAKSLKPPFRLSLPALGFLSAIYFAPQWTSFVSPNVFIAASLGGCDASAPSPSLCASS